MPIYISRSCHSIPDPVLAYAQRKSTEESRRSIDKKEEEGKEDEAEPDADDGDAHEGMITLVIDTICDCFYGPDNTDEKVQLQIIKVAAIFIVRHC